MESTHTSAGTTASGATRALAEHLAGASLSETPTDVVTRARHSILDWIGVTVAGAAEPAGLIAASVSIAESPNGPATLIGRSEHTGPQMAAFANGVASHALDFDDGSHWMMGHPSVAVCPAAFALAEVTDASGADLVLGVLNGLEAASRVGILVGKSHYVAGWHATGTIGTIGAAAAAASLLCLDADATAHALGLAATQAAGLKAMFGTMGKPFHAGRAASAGVLAAQLAASGFRVNPDAIEATQGFAWTASTSFDASAVNETMGGRHGVEAVSHKVHACCGGTHPTINTINRLAREHRFDAADIEHVSLYVSPLVAGMCVIDVPTTGLQGKFSLRYAAALALLGRSTGPNSFTDDAVTDLEVAAMINRVSTEPLPGRTGPVVELTVVLKDGRTIEDRVDPDAPDAAGLVPRYASDELNDHWEILVKKFRDLVTGHLGVERADQVVTRVGNLENEPSARALCTLLSTATTTASR